MVGVGLIGRFGNENGVGLEDRDGVKDGVGCGTGLRSQMGSVLGPSPLHTPTPRIPEACPAVSRQCPVYSHCIPTAHDLDPPLGAYPCDHVLRMASFLTGEGPGEG